MRYYDLDINGKVKSSYAVPQPDRELILLDDAPDDASMHDGEKWIPDQDILDAKAQVQAKAQAITAAKEKVDLLEKDVDKTNDFEALKKLVFDLIKQVKILTT